jgi:hypothetical protein
LSFGVISVASVAAAEEAEASTLANALGQAVHGVNCPFEVFSAYGDAKVNVTSGHPIGARLKSADFACCANPFRNLNSESDCALYLI